MIKHLLVTVKNFKDGRTPEFSSSIITDTKFERIKMEIDKENENNDNFTTVILNWMEI